MKKVMLKKLVVVGAAFASAAGPVWADGTTSSAATASATVSESISITSALSAISLTGIDLLDGSATSNTGTFTVKANANNVVYDVWLSVATTNIDTTNDVYLAKSGSNALPLDVTITGNSGANSVSANPAALQTSDVASARPTSGSKADGDAVSGTDRNTGTAYTVTLTEDTDNAANYPNVPAGTYTLSITANIAHGD